jgi:hypothetical protein
MASISKIKFVNIIKNQTPYIGKIYLKFEKHPHYTSGGKGGMLNKIHLNLGFTNLVSRIVPKRNLDGYVTDPEKIELIKKYTWGKIGTHNIGGDQSEEFTLTNSFLSQDGTFIGDVKEGWRYYKNNLIVCREYPRGVAIELKTYNPVNKVKNLITGPYDNYVTEQTENDNIVGYWGYTHRGGQTFKIGDRLFQGNYKPQKEDYTEKEWTEFERKFQKSLDNAEDDFDRNWMEEDGISCVIPFRLRGSKLIETWDEARQAAINMSKYLS